MHRFPRSVRTEAECAGTGTHFQRAEQSIAKERTYPGAYVQDKFKIILSVRMNIKGKKQASLIQSISRAPSPIGSVFQF